MLLSLDIHNVCTSKKAKLGAMVTNHDHTKQTKCNAYALYHKYRIISIESASLRAHGHMEKGWVLLALLSADAKYLLN